MPEPIVQDVSQQPLPPVQPPIEPKKKSNLKTIAILLIVILLIAGGVYAGMKIGRKQITSEAPTAGEPEVITETIAPKPSETVNIYANWGTYNSKCNFTLKYPPAWKAEPYFMADSDSACGYLVGSDYKIYTDSRERMYIGISRHQLGKDGVNSLDDYVHLSEKIIEPKPSPITATEKTFGGFEGKEFVGYGFEPGVSFAFINGNYIYELNRSEKTQEIYISQILSTFKFTN